MKQISTPQNPRILIIDDNPAIHEDFRKIFDTHASHADWEASDAAFFGDEPSTWEQAAFSIDSAHQGQEGLTRIKTALEEGRPYALAFVDVRMPPGWDGIETVSKIWEIYPDLQVVLCTAYSDYSWEEMTAKVGASDRLVILKKPFDNVEVLQMAHALSAKWQLLQRIKGQIGSLELTVAERTAELHKSEAHFRLIAENAADLITVLDTYGDRIYDSPSYQRVLGFSPDELRKSPVYGKVHPEDRPALMHAIKEALTTGEERVSVYRIQHQDGTWRVLESHANAARNAAGEIEHLVVVARDVTQRKKEEEERKQMEVQLRHAQKLESIGQLAAGIAHEINTPTQYIGDNTHFVQDGFRDITSLLAAHRQLLEAAKSGSVDAKLIAEVEAAAEAADIDYLVAEIPKAIEQSLQGVRRVSKIVGAMKDFSHPGSDEKSAVDLNRAIESTITVASNEWKYIAEMVTDFDPNLPLAPCLPGEFNQVILNMIVNASHAIGDVVGDGSGGKGTIRISTRTEGDWVEIRIADTGAGIREEIRNKIFDPFFTTKGVGKGTGQGLAIAHSVIVDKHGGDIRLESELGKGSTFIIRLPLEKRPA